MSMLLAKRRGRRRGSRASLSPQQQRASLQAYAHAVVDRVRARSTSQALSSASSASGASPSSSPSVSPLLSHCACGCVTPASMRALTAAALQAALTAPQLRRVATQRLALGRCSFLACASDCSAAALAANELGAQRVVVLAAAGMRFCCTACASAHAHLMATLELSPQMREQQQQVPPPPGSAPLSAASFSLPSPGVRMVSSPASQSVPASPALAALLAGGASPLFHSLWSPAQRAESSASSSGPASPVLPLSSRRRQAARSASSSSRVVFAPLPQVQWRLPTRPAPPAAAVAQAEAPLGDTRASDAGSDPQQQQASQAADGAAKSTAVPATAAAAAAAAAPASASAASTPPTPTTDGHAAPGSKPGVPRVPAFLRAAMQRKAAAADASSPAASASAAAGAAASSPATTAAAPPSSATPGAAAAAAGGDGADVHASGAPRTRPPAAQLALVRAALLGPASGGAKGDESAGEGAGSTEAHARTSSEAAGGGDTDASAAATPRAGGEGDEGGGDGASGAPARNMSKLWMRAKRLSRTASLVKSTLRRWQEDRPESRGDEADAAGAHGDAADAPLPASASASSDGAHGKSAESVHRVPDDAGDDEDVFRLRDIVGSETSAGAASVVQPLSSTAASASSSHAELLAPYAMLAQARRANA